jgi:hypothetical protein
MWSRDGCTSAQSRRQIPNVRGSTKSARLNAVTGGREQCAYSCRWKKGGPAIRGRSPACQSSRSDGENNNLDPTDSSAATAGIGLEPANDSSQMGSRRSVAKPLRLQKPRNPCGICAASYRISSSILLLGRRHIRATAMRDLRRHADGLPHCRVRVDGLADDVTCTESTPHNLGANRRLSLVLLQDASVFFTLTCWHAELT